MYKWFILFFGCLVISCDRNESPETVAESSHSGSSIEVDIDSLRLRLYLDSIYAVNDLIDIHQLDTSILIELRYASQNNFLGIVLYDTIRTAYLQRSVAERLIECQKYLDSLHPGYRLKVYDAVRPLEIQWKMWKALDSIPVVERGKFVSNPVLGSVHNFGAAVDITICKQNGEELDMGAGYDDFRPIAFPSMEAKFLKSGDLSSEQYENRKLLRAVMRSQKFVNIPSEWWHFNAYSRLTAETKFPALINESGVVMRRTSARIAYTNKLETDSLSAD